MSLEDMTKIDNLKSWTSGVEVEWEAVQQLRNIAALPILAGHVAVMPDVHLGKGATVGSVIPTRRRSFRALSAWTSAAAWLPCVRRSTRTTCRTR
jgi:hypothetical protein